LRNGILPIGMFRILCANSLVYYITGDFQSQVFYLDFPLILEFFDVNIRFILQNRSTAANMKIEGR